MPPSFWILLEQGWRRWWWQMELSIRRAKLQSNRHRQLDTYVFTGRTPFLLPNQQRQEYWRERKYHILQNCSPQELTRGLHPCLDWHYTPGYLGNQEWHWYWLPILPLLPSAPWRQYPISAAYVPLMITKFFPTKMVNTLTLSIVHLYGFHETWFEWDPSLQCLRVHPEDLGP